MASIPGGLHLVNGVIFMLLRFGVVKAVVLKTHPMAKVVVDTDRTDRLSPEARKWLNNQMVLPERHVVARAGLLAAQSNDDVVLPSHIESAWNEIIGRRSYKKQLGIAIALSTIRGGVAQGLLGGFGKSIGESLQHLLR